MAMTIELKPCPFCGGEVQLDHPTDPRAKNITFILCDGCGAVTSFLPNLTGSKAIQAYNRRAYITPCGGCGNSDPEKRCLNCRHDFNAAHADLSVEVRELVEAATEIADNTENWNRAVIEIIGRQPNTGIGTERLRAALAKFTQEKP
jgi:Lar family restriction alleviation protein